MCLKNINDIQLAMVVLRLYEGQVDSGNELTCKKLLKMKVLGEGKEEENVRSYDPFLRSMASWVLNDYVASLETLLEEDDGDEVEDVSAFTRQSSFKIKTPRLNKGLGYSGSNLGGAAELTSNVDDSHKLTARSSVFNFYVFLRTHPLIIRQQKSNHPNRQVNQSDSINSVERRSLVGLSCLEMVFNKVIIISIKPTSQTLLHDSTRTLSQWLSYTGVGGAVEVKSSDGRERGGGGWVEGEVAQWRRYFFQDRNSRYADES